VIVAHSLGTVVAQKLLPKLSMRVRKTILVDGFMEPKFVDHPRPAVESSVDWKFDADAFHEHTEEYAFLADETESVFSLVQHRKMAQFYQAPLQVVRPKEEHFCAEIEPAILALATMTGWHTISDEQLPVTLPLVEKYEPTETGESPLASMEDWVRTSCPHCGKPARRETDTMPNWAGSSWYFLRYIDPHNDKVFADAEKLKYWMPVDLYNGGMEHTTLHLLYSRFWNKFLFDQGYVPVSEPYARRHSHGLVLAQDGQKMSKSKGNVINPDEIVVEYGADALRMYILFMGPFEEPVPWSKNGLVGVRRFLEKVDRYAQAWQEQRADAQDAGMLVEPYLKRVNDDIEAFHFNTAVSSLMELLNRLLEKNAQGHMTIVHEDQLQRILKILCPFAPHLANELWERLGWKGFVEEQPWPKMDATLLMKETVEMAVQVNGKVRASIRLASGAGEEEAKTIALTEENVQKYVKGKVIRKIVYVPGKILNIVTEENA
jgi:leucyl-tRNA synthetase